MVKFSRTRPAIERQHLQEFFELDDPYTLSVDVAAAEHAADGANNEHLNERLCTVRVNTIELGLKDDEIKKPVAASARAINMEKYLAMPWAGQYFAGMPVELEAKPAPGYRFSHWSVKGLDMDKTQIHNPELSLTPTQDTTLSELSWCLIVTA